MLAFTASVELLNGWCASAVNLPRSTEVGIRSNKIPSYVYTQGIHPRINIPVALGLCAAEDASSRLEETICFHEL